MSYDLEVCVKVADISPDRFVRIARPERDTPTYNLGTMFRKCTGWNFKQGECYNVKEVLPLIEQGIHELEFNAIKYKQYEAPNGWGTISWALDTLVKLKDCIKETVKYEELPLENLYVRW